MVRFGLRAGVLPLHRAASPLRGVLPAIAFGEGSLSIALFVYMYVCIRDINGRRCILSFYARRYLLFSYVECPVMSKRVRFILVNVGVMLMYNTLLVLSQLGGEPIMGIGVAVHALMIAAFHFIVLIITCIIAAFRENAEIGEAAFISAGFVFVAGIPAAIVSSILAAHL